MATSVTINGGVMTMPAELSAAPAGQGVLSVYLRAAPGQPAATAVQFAFRDGCKALRTTLPEGERERFEAAAGQIDRYLAGAGRHGHQGLAVFAAGDGRWMQVLPLPAPPTEGIVWDEHPHLLPLAAVLAEHGRVGVVLFDSRHTRLLTVALGGVESSQRFEDDVPDKQGTGGWYALAQTRIERHRENHLHRHVQRTIDALAALRRSHPFEGWLLAGPVEARQKLLDALPRSLRDALAGTLSLPPAASDADVLTAVETASTGMIEERERRLVADLTALSDTPRAALGLEPVLEALYERRVGRLVVTKDAPVAGGRCPSCFRLSQDELCPVCRSAITAAPSLSEEMLADALSQGAAVDVLTSAAAAGLAGYSGVAALLH